MLKCVCTVDKPLCNNGELSACCFLSPTCRPAAAASQGKQLVVHGGAAAPGQISAEAKAALTGTIMIPTAAGGQVGVPASCAGRGLLVRTLCLLTTAAGAHPVLSHTQGTTLCVCRRSTPPRLPSHGGCPASGRGPHGTPRGACIASSLATLGALCDGA